MTKELNTNWFDLKNYEVLTSLSIEDWASVLESRHYINGLCDYAKGKSDEDFEWDLQAMADDLKAGHFGADAKVDCYINHDRATEKLIGHPFSTTSVDVLRNYQAWEMAEDKWPGPESNAFQKMRDEWLKPREDGKDRDDLLEAAHAPYDLRFKQYLNRDYIPFLLHLVVDLNAPDEQVLNDMKYLLPLYRKITGYRIPKKLAHKKLFTQKTFDYWIEYGLIPYLDLVLIAKIEDKEITQGKLAELIFPDEFEVDGKYRIRTITKPEAERLMEDATIWALMRQAADEKLANAENT
jgi:hypothetical protein